ncbi:MAG: RecX family transcriptional regulator, partial [Desulfosalsimonas sp.]
MSQSITAISPQKKNRGRCNIFVDGEYAFSLSEKLAASLQVGAQLGPEEKQRLLSEDQKQKAFEKSLGFLQYRPRSRAEITAYLEKKDFSGPAVQNAVSRLESYGYIDDEAFARMWIESRSRSRPKGEFALRYELRQKGVNEAIIDRMLAGFDETGPAWRAVAPRLSTWAKLDRTQL